MESSLSVIDLGIEDYFSSGSSRPLIDVRTPAEFAKGHIVGAVNIPLFSNDERAHVGMVYVQESKERALELGYTYVTPKLERFISESRKIASKQGLAIYCWRGGMRSHAFADHLIAHGFKNVCVIIGGYKTFRNYAQNFFDQKIQLRILGGYTGSGKTYILKSLQESGEQVIDLEGLAHHKGSAFGAIGERPQPSLEQFENELFFKLQNLDYIRPVWIEDESRKIGRVSIPNALFEQMRNQVVYFVDIPKEKRATFLVGEYSFSGNELLAKAINGIAKRLGGLSVKLAHEHLAENNYYEVALLALQYYDKAYHRGVENRDSEKVIRISLPDTNHTTNVKQILDLAKNTNDPN
jgi:tRNA 2-selenouridine synthase